MSTRSPRRTRTGCRPGPRAEFATRAPGIDWDAFFDAARLGGEERIVAWHAEPVRGLSALVASEPLEVWKDWLAFHTASRMTAVLPQAYDDLRFSFYGRILSGQQQQRPRERRAIQATSNALVDAVGQIYVERHFPRLGQGGRPRDGPQHRPGLRPPPAPGSTGWRRRPSPRRGARSRR